jgi:hypothetical protein
VFLALEGTFPAGNPRENFVQSLARVSLNRGDSRRASPPSRSTRAPSSWARNRAPSHLWVCGSRWRARNRSSPGSAQGEKSSYEGQDAIGEHISLQRLDKLPNLGAPDLGDLSLAPYRKICNSSCRCWYCQLTFLSLGNPVELPLMELLSLGSQVRVLPGAPVFRYFFVTFFCVR